MDVIIAFLLESNNFFGAEIKWEMGRDVEWDNGRIDCFWKFMRNTQINACIIFIGAKSALFVEHLRLPHVRWLELSIVVPGEEIVSFCFDEFRLRRYLFQSCGYFVSGYFLSSHGAGSFGSSPTGLSSQPLLHGFLTQGEHIHQIIQGGQAGRQGTHGAAVVVAL